MLTLQAASAAAIQAAPAAQRVMKRMLLCNCIRQGLWHLLHHVR